MTNIKSDISNRNDVILLVDTFYNHIQSDELLGPIFQVKIQDHWPVHLEKMYNFWSTILLDEHTYKGAPFAAHIKLDINEEHFKRWLLIFFSTIDELFEGEKVEEAKWRAVQMGKNFSSKLEFIRNNPQYKPIQ